MTTMRIQWSGSKEESNPSQTTETGRWLSLMTALGPHQLVLGLEQFASATSTQDTDLTWLFQNQACPSVGGQDRKEAMSANLAVLTTNTWNFHATKK